MACAARHRQTALVVLFVATVAAAAVAWRRRGHRPEQHAEPLWPAFEATPPARWLAPVDGKCPDGYPVKANDNSGIFHIPGGRFYDRTVPERCYATGEDAEADGYRRAKA